MKDLPSIDIAPYHPSTYSTFSDEARAAKAQALHIACRDVGFFYLKIDQFIPIFKMDQILEKGRAFFKQSPEEKEKVHDPLNRARGWQRMNEEITLGMKDHHESFDIYASEDKIKGVPDAEKILGGKNLWPDYPEGWQDEAGDWVKQMCVVGRTLMKAMTDGLTMSSDEWVDFEKLIDDPFCIVRFIGYPPLPDNHVGLSIGEHKDFGCLTLLHADPTPGALQVLLRETETAAPSSPPDSSAVSPINLSPHSQIKHPEMPFGQWISPVAKPGSIIVNIGSMWEKWTGGLYPSTVHRVIHLGNTYRVSIPFFFEPKFDAKVLLLEAAKRKGETELRYRVGSGDLGRDVGDERIYGEHLYERISYSIAGFKGQNNEVIDIA